MTTPDEHEYDSAAWPLITIAGLCLVPIVIASVGAWLFGWRGGYGASSIVLSVERCHL